MRFSRIKPTTPTRSARSSRRLKCEVVIPSKRNRVRAIDYDKDLYKARSAVECTFNLLTRARRFATRYEKTKRNYAAVVALGCAWLWL